MRRGRPDTSSKQATSGGQSGAPTQGDPFAALDSANLKVRAQAVDDLSNKFPSLEDFSIATDKRSSFQFPRSSQTANRQSETTTKLTKALADDAFASGRAEDTDASKPIRSQQNPQQLQSQDNRPTKPAKPSAKAQPPSHVKSGYISTGTSSSPPPVAKSAKKAASEWNPKPIWKVPTHHKSPSLPPAPSAAVSESANRLHPSPASTLRPTNTDIHRSQSQSAMAQAHGPRSSSRSSFERQRPQNVNVQPEGARTRSASRTRSRPPSSSFVDSNLDFLRDHERDSQSKKRPSLEFRRSSRQNINASEVAVDDDPIRSDTDYLRTVEADNDRTYRGHLRSSSSTRKRDSMPSISQIAGKFGDAFRRFDRSRERESNEKESRIPPPIRTMTPPASGPNDQHLLSPISGSEATQSPPRRSEEDYTGLEEVEDVSPEVRRELERQRLIQEERRVAEAAADHRSRASDRTASSTRARTIQNRVQAYLQEGQQSPVKKTAAGYGHYTDSSETEQGAPFSISSKQLSGPPASTGQGLDVVKQRQQPIPVAKLSAAVINRTGPRPAAKPKPVALRTRTPVQGIERAATAPPSATTETPSSAGSHGSRLATLLARDQEGVATPGRSSQDPLPIDTPSSLDNDKEQGDWEAEFSKRFPSLGGIEMAETEIGGLGRGRPQQGLRVRDV